MAEAVADKAHSRRSPSGAKKRKLCPGSVVLEAGREDRASRYAAEGTVAHAVMELCLEPCTRGEHEALDAEGFIGRVLEADGFEFAVDEEMADKVNEFVAHVLHHVDPAAGDVLLVEQLVPIDHITGEEGGSGTADVVGITEGGTRIVVLDLKYGKGVRVMASDSDVGIDDAEFGMSEHRRVNPQLAFYGLGVLEEQGLLFDLQNVTLGIGQPRLDHFDTVDLTVEELRAVGGELRKVERTCDSAEADAKTEFFADRYLHPGEDQCRFCKAKGICPALRGEVIDLVGSGAAVADDFSDLEVADASAVQFVAELHDDKAGWLGNLMAKLPLIEGWITAVRAEAERELFAGRPVEGFKLVQGKQGNRAWRDQIEATAVLKAARLKVDDIFDQKLKSPTQIEKGIAKDKPKVWAKLQALIGRSEGQPSVAPASDKRPALDLTSAATDFADLGADDGSEFI